ncbi:amidohydrolase family protein [Planctomicrobium sp. SH668]|uniref:amidohydrolase family protein n=1 Tax=Planctomicrobium sp. SH668 TaxID=3448126 RepID=UPI003F5C1126
MNRFRARWFFPGNEAPVRNAIITVDNETIVAIQSHTTEPVADLGDVAIIPGLINAHTHLEFSDLNAPIEPRHRFADWIQAVISQRRSQDLQPLESVSLGVAESAQRGTTSIAEIATSDWIFDYSLNQTSPSIFLFREVLGLSRDRVDQQLAGVQEFLNQAEHISHTKIGLSPHSPYSMHPALFRGVCNIAVQNNLTLAMHLAESPAELELLRSGTGQLVALLDRMNLWIPGEIPLNSRPLDYLRELARAPRSIVVHGNLLDEEELVFLAAHPHMSVVYCPRTHDAMQEGAHPWQRMISRGINVAIGTDGRSSNPNLSIWEELQFLKGKFADLRASKLLKLATVNAAQALGDSSIGELNVGKIANLCLVPLTPEGVAAPEEFLFQNDVCRTMLAGNWL